MYTSINFKSKKALKEAVAARRAYLETLNIAADCGPMTVGALVASQARSARPITVFQPNDMFGNPAGAPDYSGRACVEGPHYPEPHRWYATVIIENGEVVKVS